VVDYRAGSGRGRLRQYANSARLTAQHPLLGVGPGNWSVRYPRWAPRDDPSLTPDRATANPWPSSDWVAVASERGLPALCAMGVVMVALAWQAHLATWRATDPERVLLGATLGATLAATLVVGAFDAVLLLAAPALVVWPALGALAGAATGEAPLPDSPGARRLWRLGGALLALVSLVGAVRSGAQIAAMHRFLVGTPAAVTLAARLDPGSYRIRLRAAELARAQRRCPEVRAHANALVALYPNAVRAAASPRRVRPPGTLNGGDHYVAGPTVQARRPHASRTSTRARRAAG
jgi:hypothetical protein